MGVYPPEFEKRTLDDVRRWTDDMADCDNAKISVEFYGGAPGVRFLFEHPLLKQNGSPCLIVMMVAESRKNPLAPGRLMQGEELKRVVRDRIDAYFKLNGLQIARKAMYENACL